MTFIAGHLGAVLWFTLLVGAPVGLGLVAVRLHESQTRRSSLPQRLLLVLTVWCVVQALVAHLLGVLQQLRGPGVLAAELLVLGGSAVGLARSGSRAGASGWMDRRRLVPVDRLATLTLLTLAFMGLTLVWWSAAMPVVDYDSWAFHMPHMAQWLQSGTFTRMVQDATRPRNSYPYGWEALCTLFLTPFGEDLLVTFPNVVAWSLLGLATYLLARLWRAQRIHALACAALLLAVPCVAEAVNTMHVDLPFAALFIAAAYYGAVYGRRGDPLMLGLGAATMGLACGTRVTGPAYAVLLAAWTLYLRVSVTAEAPQRGGERRLPLVVGLGMATFLGGFWYVKNLIEVGHLLGFTPQPGPASVDVTWASLTSSTLVLSFDPRRLSSWKALGDRAFGELGVPFVGLIALAVLWPLSVILPRRQRNQDSAIALALLVLGTGALFWVTPYSATSTIQVRLGLPLLASLAVAAAVGASRTGLPGEVSVTLALLSAARTFGGSRVVYVLVLLLVGWGVWRARWATAAGSRIRSLAMVGALGLAVVVVTLLARERRERERVQVYGAFYEYLEQHVGPAERVAYLLSNRSYLFYGRHLARTLVYAPLAEGQRVDDWAEQLRRQRIAIVAAGPWSGDSATARGALGQLTAAGGPLEAVSGHGAPGEVSLFRLKREAVTGETADAPERP